MEKKRYMQPQVSVDLMEQELMVDATNEDTGDSGKARPTASDWELEEEQ